MNHRTPTLIAAALSLALCAPLALAQDWSVASQEGQAIDTKLTWAELDADGDDMLSAEEAAGIETLGDAFDEADANDDGLLTAEEYRDWYQAQQPADDGMDDGMDQDGMDQDDGADDGSSDRDPDTDGGTRG